MTDPNAKKVVVVLVTFPEAPIFLFLFIGGADLEAGKIASAYHHEHGADTDKKEDGGHQACRDGIIVSHLSHTHIEPHGGAHRQDKAHHTKDLCGLLQDSFTLFHTIHYLLWLNITTIQWFYSIRQYRQQYCWSAMYIWRTGKTKSISVRNHTTY